MDPESEPDCGYPMCAHAEQCEPRFTIDEIAAYLAGWTMGPYDDVEDLAKKVSVNALSQLRCDQDGINVTTKLKRKRESQMKPHIEDSPTTPY
jgi:hypothetical protein